MCRRIRKCYVDGFHKLNLLLFITVNDKIIVNICL